jgi:adenosylcobinamide-GDP ribazoletransferase
VFVGCLSAVVYHLLSWTNFSHEVKILLSMLALTLVTGGLHEDGLADTMDAIGGGGSDREKILLIMKDSRLGTFGVLGLGFNLLLKFCLLSSLPPHLTSSAFILMSAGPRFPLLFYLWPELCRIEAKQIKGVSQSLVLVTRHATG